ncbi:ubiquitin-specific protease ubp15 [Linderina macrospora]|uniref:Ubiquitin-specific protease ubp15 n=1 Tax=Linderina macrospora TaxID=4868 RepID=A0ACC1J046_9FUNG|nr:ubiquitin-specific protease ubp15 [Linderina macrospora]
MVAGELDVVGRAAVGSAEAPVGGYGVDENGQYIEIKFPSMGHAAGHATAAAMHAGGNAVSSQTVGSQPGGNGNVVARQGPIVKSQATESLPTPVPHQQHQSESESEVDAPGPVSVLDTAAYVDRHMEDIVLDRQAYFWNIANWDALDKRATSDVFQCGGHSWRILLRPFGSSHKGVLSFFLESMDTQHGNPDVKITCKFVLAVANPNDPTHSTSGSAYHCFNQNNPNWGFTRFMKLAELRTGLTPGAKPFIENGACTICAYVHVLRDPSH